MSINIGAHQIDTGKAFLMFTNSKGSSDINNRISVLTDKLFADHDIIPANHIGKKDLISALKVMLGSGSTAKKINETAIGTLGTSTQEASARLQEHLEQFALDNADIIGPDAKNDSSFEATYQKKIKADDAALLTMGKSLGTDLKKTGVKLLEIIALPIIYLGDLAIFTGKAIAAAAKGVGTFLAGLGHAGSRLMRPLTQGSSSAKLFFEKLMVATETGKMMTKETKDNYDKNTSIGGTAATFKAVGKLKRPLGGRTHGSPPLSRAPSVQSLSGQGFAWQDGDSIDRSDRGSQVGFEEGGSELDFEDEGGLDAFATRSRLASDYPVDGGGDPLYMDDEGKPIMEPADLDARERARTMAEAIKMSIF
jgi:hypothetical protein